MASGALSCQMFIGFNATDVLETLDYVASPLLLSLNQHVELKYANGATDDALILCVVVGVTKPDQIKPRHSAKLG